MTEPAMLLAAEHAVDLGATLLRQGRAHVGTLIDKGDRDYATAVDVGIARHLTPRAIVSAECLPSWPPQHRE